MPKEGLKIAVLDHSKGAILSAKYLRYLIISCSLFVSVVIFYAGYIYINQKINPSGTWGSVLADSITKATPKTNLYLENQVAAQKNEKSKLKEFPSYTVEEEKEEEETPQAQIPQANFDGRGIVLSLSQQMMYFYENGTLINQSVISSGSWATPTPVGNFAIFTKSDMGYGGEYGQVWAMPYWMGVVDGVGIHALPYINGVKEPANSLGQPISHGCIRLPDDVAIWAYGWASIGTPVNIQY